jgi:hypothetical protein
MKIYGSMRVGVNVCVSVYRFDSIKFCSPFLAVVTEMKFDVGLSKWCVNKV